MAGRLLAGAVLASTVLAQSGGIQRGLQYGENWVPTTKDSDLVAANFPDVSIALLAPAFLDPSTVPGRFANGSEGPTDLFDLGEHLPGHLTDTSKQALTMDRFLRSEPGQEE
jgi:hypothetical protein